MLGTECVVRLIGVSFCIALVWQTNRRTIPFWPSSRRRVPCTTVHRRRCWTVASFRWSTIRGWHANAPSFSTTWKIETYWELCWYASANWWTPFVCFGRNNFPSCAQLCKYQKVIVFKIWLLFFPSDFDWDKTIHLLIITGVICSAWPHPILFISTIATAPKIDTDSSRYSARSSTILHTYAEIRKFVITYIYNAHRYRFQWHFWSQFEHFNWMPRTMTSSQSTRQCVTLSVHGNDTFVMRLDQTR